MTDPHHRLKVRGRRGALALDVDLAFFAPWTVIFGPSGSGKSSLLRAACGLLPGAEVHFTRRQPAPDQPDAWIELQGETRTLPPNWRGLSYAPQSTAVFPHMSVRQNIAFGARGSSHNGKADPAAARRALEEAIELFAMQPLLGRRPAELSGGERQGVSLARAFAVPDAQLLLLDEPFSGIDRAMRDALLPRMRAALARRRVPAVSVTHDVEEALLLDAWVIRIDAGKVVAQGPAADVLDAERTRIIRTLRA